MQRWPDTLAHANGKDDVYSPLLTSIRGFLWYISRESNLGAIVRQDTGSCWGMYPREKKKVKGVSNRNRYKDFKLIRYFIIPIEKLGLKIHQNKE